MKLSEITMEILTQAGWYEGRKIDIQDIKDLFAKNGLPLFEVAEKFLIEFGMLEITFPKQGSPFNTMEYHHFNPILMVLDYDDGEYYTTLEEELSDKIGEKIIPIGTTYREHLNLLLTPSEKFYAYGMGVLWLLGNNTKEMLECLCTQTSGEFIGEC